MVEPRSFLMIGPCAICAAPQATELARSSGALKVSARTVCHRRRSPLASLSGVHGGTWSLPRGRKRRTRIFLTFHSKERSCARHIVDFCHATGVGTRRNRGVATKPLQLVGEFAESSEISRHRPHGAPRFLFSQVRRGEVALVAPNTSPMLNTHPPLAVPEVVDASHIGAYARQRSSPN